jgi:polyketide synthase 5
MLPNITDMLVEKDWAPKAYGEGNPHCATHLSRSTGSACSRRQRRGVRRARVLRAANSWLDASRTGAGRTTAVSTIAWGAWAEIGRTALFAEGDAASFRTMCTHSKRHCASCSHTGYAAILGHRG